MAWSPSDIIFVKHLCALCYRLDLVPNTVQSCNWYPLPILKELVSSLPKSSPLWGEYPDDQVEEATCHGTVMPQLLKHKLLPRTYTGAECHPAHFSLPAPTLITSCTAMDLPTTTRPLQTDLLPPPHQLPLVHRHPPGIHWAPLTHNVALMAVSMAHHSGCLIPSIPSVGPWPAGRTLTSITVGEGQPPGHVLTPSPHLPFFLLARSGCPPSFLF